MQVLPMSPLRTRFQAYSVLICLIGIAILLFFVLRFAGGQLVYTLDDPYIHLSLAENLLRGHYGVNLDEVASPSSSILYPFLLAGTLGLGLGDLGPFVLNVIGALGAAWLMSGFFWDAVAKSASGRLSVLSYVAVPALLFAINGFALAFTGMEHTLHVFASLAIILGLSRLSSDHAPSLLFFVAVVAVPLLRFEGFALAGAALFAVALWGYWTRAIITGTIIVGIVTSYILLMKSLGLPLMPSSVMVKSGPAAAMATSHFSSIFGEVLLSFRDSLKDQQGVVLTVAVVLLLLGAIRAKNRPQARTVAIVAATASVAHLLVGRWNWFGRYEIYIIATAIAALLTVWSPWLSKTSRQLTGPILVIVMAPLVGFTYIYVTYLTPYASQNIYDQQYQMHRFAVEYSEPVAVIDLGWVTYRNDEYVLDLWGLGSETARQLFNAEGHTPGPIRRMTTDASVTYAMLYEEVFDEGLPQEWCRIAQLSTSQVTASFGTVEFFLIDPEKEDLMRSALQAFAPTLPDASTIAVFDCPAQ
jgi:hypothetical protein